MVRVCKVDDFLPCVAKVLDIERPKFDCVSVVGLSLALIAGAAGAAGCPRGLLPPCCRDAAVLLPGAYCHGAEPARAC